MLFEIGPIIYFNFMDMRNINFQFLNMNQFFKLSLHNV